jgi:hypothetical protein
MNFVDNDEKMWTVGGKSEQDREKKKLCEHSYEYVDTRKAGNLFLKNV